METIIYFCYELCQKGKKNTVTKNIQHSASVACTIMTYKLG